MADVPPRETLSPPMDRHDSSDQPNPSENHSHSSAADTNLTQKRKRELEPDPESSSDKAPMQQHPLWKTSLCSYFRRSGGSCSHGESCRYAHGEAELRPRPDNTWDPTSERAKKMAKTDEKEKEEEEAEEGGVMMTEAMDEGVEDSSSGLSKCFVNLPMKWSSDNLRNFLNEQGILCKSAKKKKGMIVGFVTFESAAQVKTAVEELDGKSIGNNRTLKVSDVIPRPFEKNNKVALPPHSAEKMEKPSPDSDSNTTQSTNNDEADEDGSLLHNGSVLKGRSARDAVTPLAHMSYSDQLEHKKNSLAQTLKRLTRNARKACPNGVSLPEWILKSREIGGLPCKLEGIIESPLVNGYRNKCEFSVGNSLQGKHTVGFLLGNFREGVTAVEEPVDCPNVSRIACKYAAVFQEFLQHSLLPVWNRLNNTGFWRQLTVREGREPCKMAEVDNPETRISEVLLIVQVCTLGFDDGQVKDELQRLAHAFSVGSPPLPLTALVIQVRSEGQVYILAAYSLKRRLRIRTLQFGTARNINEIYDSVDPEVVLSILVHEVILSSLEHGVREGRILLHEWLVNLVAQYNDAFKIAEYTRGSLTTSHIDVAFTQCPQLQPLPRLVFALLRNPLLRFHEEGVHPDYRIYLQCLFSALEPSSLSRAVYPLLASYDTPDKQAFPRHSLSRAALITSGSPIFFLDAFTTLIVFYSSTANAALPFPPPQDGLLRTTINKLKQERIITPKLIFIRGGQDDATAFENYLIEEQDVEGSGFTSVMGFVSFLDEINQDVVEYINKSNGDLRK